MLYCDMIHMIYTMIHDFSLQTLNTTLYDYTLCYKYILYNKC